MGLSAILWWIFIVVILFLGIILYSNTKKSDLINVKEMLRSKSFLYICYSLCFSLIQVGVFFPDNFMQFYFLGYLVLCFSATFYFYFWERNLTSIKRIPTISVGAATVVIFIALMISLFFIDFLGSLVNFLVLTTLSLVAIAFILYIYLIFVFSKNVKGISTVVGGIWMIGMALTMIGLSFENSPGVITWISPVFIVLYFSPIILMIGLFMDFYGITKLFAEISSYYAQTQKCAVHRGYIEKGTTVYYCPSCGITYCDACFNQVIINDGCWNCRKGAQAEVEEKWKVEKVLEIEKEGKYKPKNPK